MVNSLISCIMATRNRPRLFAQALRCFNRQRYPERELIVVDDGEPAVAPMCQGFERVHYIHLARPASTGAKLNLGIAEARGRTFRACRRTTRRP